MEERKFAYSPRDWPHGILCEVCDHEFAIGDFIWETFESMFADGVPVLALVCEKCATQDVAR
jgi:hypothetical protein